jgi:branched-chain amino acid transport system substrate-binding protein
MVDSKVLMVVLIVAGLVIGTGIGYYASPPKIETITQTKEVIKSPLDGLTVKIGCVAGTVEDLNINTPLIKDIALADLNAYAKTLGLNTKFDVLIDNAGGQASTHLEKIQAFKSMGIDMVIGSGWSSMISASKNYVDTNDMLLFSTGSTSPLLNVVDNIFRLCPTDFVQGPAISEILYSWGIKGLIIIHRGDSWGDGLYNIISVEYPKRGGEIIVRVRYASEVKEFSSYLQTADDKAKEAIAKYGAEHVGVWIGAFSSDLLTVITQAADYPNLMKILWFGCEDAGRSSLVIDQVPQAVLQKLRIMSSLMGPSGGWKWDDFQTRFTKMLNIVPGFYEGNYPDLIGIIGRSVIATGSSNAMNVKTAFAKVASDYFGVTGWCDLDAAGDRKPGVFDIWGYAVVDGKTTFLKYGEYDARDLSMTWDITNLQSQGLVRPGW